MTTYCHLMLINSHGSHPSGHDWANVYTPVQEIESHYFFASSLVGLYMMSLRAFGTDGEKTLANALHILYSTKRYMPVVSCISKEISILDYKIWVYRNMSASNSSEMCLKILSNLKMV